MANRYESSEDDLSSTDRDGNTTDDGKRKRTEGKEEENNFEIFKRSKKIQRTPVKKAKSRKDEEGTMEEMKEMMRAMMAEMQGLRKGQENFCQEVKILREQNQTMMEEMKVLRNRVAVLEAKEMEAEKGIRREKKNNILITGLHILEKDEPQMKKKIEEFIEQKMEVSTEIKAVYRVREQMFVAKLESFEKKMEIMSRKKNLKI